MKKLIRFASLSLALSFVFCLITPFTFAATETATSSTSLPESSLFRIEFESGMAVTSSECQYNLSAVLEHIKQVSFTVDGGSDIFTIGYHVGSTPASLQTILAKIKATVNNVNRDISSNERLSGNSPISFECLELKDFHLSIPSSFSSLSSSYHQNSNLIGVRNTFQVITDAAIESSPSHSSPLNVRNSLSSITSTYHYLHYNPDGSTLVYWHNTSSNTDTWCASASPTSPHMGDGNSRYAAGYRWFPRYVEANFISEDCEPQHSTTLWYKFDQTGLNNLLVDNNETLEMELQFYNLGHNTDDPNNRGTAWQFLNEDHDFSYYSNQPDYYLDTGFGDDETSPVLCVGVPDASLLEADRWYYWAIYSDKGTDYGYPQDGRFRINAQRGYRVINNLPDQYMTWVVFGEEHEPICHLGVPSDGNWIPNVDAWTLDATDQVYTFDALTDPARPHD